MNELAAAWKTLRVRLEHGLNRLGAVIYGSGAPRVANTSYFGFSGIDGETLVIELDRAGFAVAPGAACSSADSEPSATLLAMGVAPEQARGAVRLSLGAANTPGDVDAFLAALEHVLARLKGLTAIAV
jgi:cysteine desulfurase